MRMCQQDDEQMRFHGEGVAMVKHEDDNVRHPTDQEYEKHHQQRLSRAHTLDECVLLTENMR